MQRMPDRQLLRDLAAGAAIALLYLPLSQVSEILWMKAASGIPGPVWMLMLLLYAAAACVYLFSANVRTALGRMILSLPFTMLFQWVLYAVHLLDRAAVWVYGSAPPAALDSVRTLRMLMVFAAVWFGVIVGIFMTGRSWSEQARAVFGRMHRAVMSAVSIIIVGSILVLHIVMP